MPEEHTTLRRERDFASVDETANPAFFVDYLDITSAMELFQSLKRQSFTLLEVREGAHILELGCGTGDDARMLAHMVGPIGRVVGVDSSQTMLAEARRRAEGSNLPVEFHFGNAEELDFPDSTFDSCRAERLFQHLRDPRKALAEMIRVARTGAWIVVVDADWESLLVDAGDRVVTRKILNYFCDSTPAGWIGRQLRGLFMELSLTEIMVVPSPLILTDFALARELFRLQSTAERAQEAGVITGAEAASWLSDLERRHQQGRFFSAMTGFTVRGRKL